MTDGWIYVAQREQDELIKIGFSADPRERIRLLERRYGDLWVIACVPGTTAQERWLHRRFDHLLAEGREWFRPADELLDAVSDPETLFARPGGLCRFSREAAA